jgi:DNA adenine methylase
MTVVKRPILRYHGGKWIQAKKTIQYFPTHKCYTEVFGGAASTLMQKPRSYAEVYNDKWDTVVNVFRVLRDPISAAELRRRIELTPFARTEFLLCGEAIIRNETDPIEKARLTIARSFMGFGSASTNAEHSTGFRSNSNRSGSTPAHDWMNYPSHIDSFVKRLKGVIIENREYYDVLKAHDAPTTLHYLDPPYVHATRNLKRGNAMYAYELSDDEHRELALHLQSLLGMVVLSGYNSDLYEELYGELKWTKIEMSAHADGAKDRVECLWLNPACSRQKLLF